MILFSDRGTPDGYYKQHGYSGHTFKCLKNDGTFVYVQVHIRADGGFKVSIAPLLIFFIWFLVRLSTMLLQLAWLVKTPIMPLSSFLRT